MVQPDFNKILDEQMTKHPDDEVKANENAQQIYESRMKAYRSFTQAAQPVPEQRNVNSYVFNNNMGVTTVHGPADLHDDDDDTARNPMSQVLAFDAVLLFVHYGSSNCCVMRDACVCVFRSAEVDE